MGNHLKKNLLFLNCRFILLSFCCREIYLEICTFFDYAKIRKVKNLTPRVHHTATKLGRLVQLYRSTERGKGGITI